MMGVSISKNCMQDSLTLKLKFKPAQGRTSNMQCLLNSHRANVIVVCTYSSCCLVFICWEKTIPYFPPPLKFDTCNTFNLIVQTFEAEGSKSSKDQIYKISSEGAVLHIGISQGRIKQCVITWKPDFLLPRSIQGPALVWEIVRYWPLSSLLGETILPEFWMGDFHILREKGNCYRLLVVVFGIQSEIWSINNASRLSSQRQCNKFLI